MKRIAALLMLSLLPGCVGNQVRTESGRPEIDIRTEKKVAMDLIANLYSRSGYTIKTVNEYSLVVEKPNDSLGAAIAFGSQFAVTPNVRVSLNFSEFGGSVHIQGRVEMVTNPGSGFENVTDVSGGAVDLQNSLQQAKTMLEGGVIGVVFNKEMVVTDVVRASPAEIAGIQRDDQIEEVAGVSVTNYEDLLSRLRGEPNTEIALVMSRKGEKKKFQVKRKTWAEVFAKKQ